MNKLAYATCLLAAIQETMKEMDVQDNAAGADMNVTGVDVENWNDYVFESVKHQTGDRR